MRDRETRTGTSKCASRLECWHTGTHHSLLQQYDRPEVSGQNALAVPTMFDFDLLFQRKDRPAAKDMSDPAEQCDWEKEAKLLNGVLKPISWPTASPASAQIIC